MGAGVSKLVEHIKRHVVEVGGCWEWRAAVQKCGSTPVMRWEGKVKAVRRLLAIEQNLQFANGKLATSKCGNWMCVHPDHVHTVTRAKLQQRIAKEMQFHTNPLRMKKLAMQARKRSRLNEELAQEIREAEGTQRAIAARYGITQATVSCIKCGKTWRDYTNPFTALMKGLHK